MIYTPNHKLLKNIRIITIHFLPICFCSDECDFDNKMTQMKAISTKYCL